MSCIYTHPRDAPRKPLEATNSVTLHDARSTHGHYVFMPALNNLKGKIIKQFQALKKWKEPTFAGRKTLLRGKYPKLQTQCNSYRTPTDLSAEMEKPSLEDLWDGNVPTEPNVSRKDNGGQVYTFRFPAAGIGAVCYSHKGGQTTGIESRVQK